MIIFYFIKSLSQLNYFFQGDINAIMLSETVILADYNRTKFAEIDCCELI